MRKTKLVTKLASLALCISMCAMPVSAADTGLASYVTPEMCSAQYWIGRTPNAYDVIMTAEEIASLNQRIANTEETHVKDLSSADPVFDGVKLAGELASFETPSAHYIAGQPVPDWYYDVIRYNISTAKVSETMYVKYGFVVNQTVMKSYPYREYLSDAASDVEWDDMANMGLNVNEPVLVYFYTGDGQFAYVESSFCTGWVPAEDIAVCKEKSQWEKVKNAQDILVVTGEKVYLEAGLADPDLSEKMMMMGTVLPLAPDKDGKITGRLSWNNYVVLMPSRDENGYFVQKRALIPANRDVHVGYLPYTTANVLTQAFKALGNRYGWGGSLYASDCSGYIQNIYRCFGLKIARNTTWQGAMPVAVASLDGLNTDQKAALLACAVPTGSILQFRGHEMLYLGSIDGKYYTINDVSSLVDPEDTSLEVIRPRSVVVNDMSTKRGSGVTWLEAMDKIIMIR